MSYEQLEEMQANYLRPETLQRATARLVNFHLRQPLTQAWGQGLTSSSDAMVFAVPVRALNATFHPKYFASAGRGISVYIHVSDLWIPFYTQVITCHVRQAPYIIDGLLHHTTHLQPTEHYTDTHGFMVMWTLSDKKTNLLTNTNLISGGNTLCKSDVCEAVRITHTLLNYSMMTSSRFRSSRVSCGICRLMVTRRIRSRLMLTICSIAQQ